jgi:hypothetical protein
MNRGSYFSLFGKQQNLTADEEALSSQHSAVSENLSPQRTQRRTGAYRGSTRMIADQAEFTAEARRTYQIG